MRRSSRPATSGRRQPGSGSRPSPPHEVRRRREDRRTVTTWTIVHRGQPISWASRNRWSAQARPLRGANPSTVPAPFQGRTLQDRHPADPPQPYTEDERQALCHLCMVPIIHRSAHLRGALHQSRAQVRTRASEPSLDAALAVIRALRPDLLSCPAQISPEPSLEGLSLVQTTDPSGPAQSGDSLLDLDDEDMI